jgi:predicted dehydrogenase
LGLLGRGSRFGDAIGQQVSNLDGTHAAALAAHPRVRLVAGASRDEGRRRRFESRQAGVKTYADWRELLARERPEIVSIATRSADHAEITAACAEAGVRAVLCEKPIATTPRRRRPRHPRVSRSAARSSPVNHSRRWHPLWRLARDEIRAGAIGDVHHAMAHWPTGRLGNVGTHLFDALRMLTGADPIAVSGTLDPLLHPDCRGPQYRDPGGWGVVTFAGGIKAFIDASQASKATAGCARCRKHGATVDARG